MKEFYAALLEVENAELTPESRVELIAAQINQLAQIRWTQGLVDGPTDWRCAPEDVDLSFIPELLRA